MEIATWSNSRQSGTTTLPKLRTAQGSQSPRRYSLSSSRTGDSGYNSDPDLCLSLSPVEFGVQDQLPYTSSDFTFDSSALLEVKEAASFNTRASARNTNNLTFLKKHKNLQKSFFAPEVEITECPTSCPKTSNQSNKCWTEDSKETSDQIPPALQGPALTQHGNIEHWVDENLQPHDLPEKRKLSTVSLSSTGSCDMYSIGDNSDDEIVEVIPSTLSKAISTTIELIMRKIELNLGYAAYLQCTGSQSSRARGSAGNRGSGGRGHSQSGGGKRKSRLDDSLAPDDPDEDGASKRRRISIATTTEDSEAGPRFACPFYKHDPNRYRNLRTCTGPGWPTVHRMKEHLYRSHAQPVFCPRCYAMFDSDDELSNHLRAHPCHISAPQPIEGINKETERSLKKRSPALRLEEDKWRDTYQLLFPEVSLSDIPSPYYDSDSPSEESRRFRRELLERIRQELFATAEREPGPVEQRLLRQVAGIIQRCENELLTPFFQDQGHLHPSMPTSRRTSAVAVPMEPTRPSFDTSSFAPASNDRLQLNQTEPPMSPGSMLPSEPNIPPPAEQNDYPPTMMLPDYSSEWVDWNVVFPPGPEETHGPGRTAFALTTAPVWT